MKCEKCKGEHIFESEVEDCHSSDINVMGTCQDAVNKYGMQSQICKSMEEFSELTIELSRWIGLERRANYKKVREEIVDCQIMINQLTLMFWDKEGLDKDVKKKLKKFRDKHLS